MSKRKADVQLTDRNYQDDDDDDDEEPTTQPIASAAVMATRRIVKGRRTQPVQESAETQPNVTSTPFNFASPSFYPAFSFATSTFATSETSSAPGWPAFSFATQKEKEEKKEESEEAEKKDKKAEKTPEKDNGEKKEEKEEKKEESKEGEKKEKKDEKAEKTPEKKADKKEEKKEENKEEKKEEAKLQKDEKAEKTSEKTDLTFNFGNFTTTPSWPTFTTTFTSTTSTTSTSPFQFSLVPPSLSNATSFLGRVDVGAVDTTSQGRSSWVIPTELKSEPQEEKSPTKLQKVDNHQTGEENETTVLEVRVKIFELERAEEGVKWAERGTGPLKINSRAGGHRIVMRTDSGLRVIINSFILGDMKMEKITDKQVKFTCVNSLENNTTKVTVFFCKIRNSG